MPPCSGHWRMRSARKHWTRVVGQRHLLAPGAVLRRLIDSGTEANMVFYGPLRHRQDHHRQHHRPADQQDSPPAQRHHRVFAGREGHHRRRWDPAGPPAGFCCTWTRSSTSTRSSSRACWSLWRTAPVTLIASTTENPYFYVYGALLSRSTVFEFKAVTPEEAEPAVLRALKIEQERSSLPLEWGGGGAPADRHRLRRRCPKGHQRGGAPLPGVRAEGREADPDNGGTLYRWHSAAPCATTRAATPCTTLPPL